MGHRNADVVDHTALQIETERASPALGEQPRDPRVSNCSHFEPSRVTPEGKGRCKHQRTRHNSPDRYDPNERDERDRGPYDGDCTGSKID
jgi:hypothetical protein